MNERDFLVLAAKLAGGSTQAEWRTAIGRAYYAAFHVARQLLEDLGFAVPRADRAHTYLALRLQNCGDPTLQRAGGDLDSLRRLRNRADYDLHRPLSQGIAQAQPQAATRIIQLLDSARQEPTRTQITDAMRNYERDVLGDVTWQQP
jgi:hypothetical protein